MNKLLVTVLSVSLTCFGMEQKDQPQQSKAVGTTPEAYYHFGILAEASEEYVTAREYYRFAIDGHAQSQFDAMANLARLLQEGLGGMQELPEAIRYYVLAGNNGKPEQYYNAGVLSETIEDYVNARRYYTLAIDGHAKVEDDAKVNLATLQLKGLGGAKDVEGAKRYFEQVARNNNPSALYNLGVIYLKGEHVKADYQRARKLLEQAQSLSAKNPDDLRFRWVSGIALGIMYEKGLGLDKPSYHKAGEEYKNSGPRGEVDYARLVWTNKISGDKQNAREVFKKRALEIGDIVATFMYSAILIAEDQEEEGVKILQEAYNKNKNILAMSMLQLGIAYWYGAGIERNQAKALDLFEKIRKDEDAEALVAQGYLYLKGLGVEQDIDKGLALIDQSKNKITMNYLDPEVLFPDIREIREHRADAARKELLAEFEEPTAGKVKIKKGKGKIKVGAESASSSSSSSFSSASSSPSSSSEARISDIFDIAPEKWNAFWQVEDGSLVSGVDRYKKIIVINDPKEKEELLVTVQNKPYRIFQNVRKLKEDPRIKQRQAAGDQQQRYNHNFAQMLDYVIQCAGSLVPWIKDGSDDPKDLLVTPVIRVDIESQKQTPCTAEYTFYKDKKPGENGKDILYHRLLRPEKQK